MRAPPGGMSAGALRGEGAGMWVVSCCKTPQRTLLAIAERRWACLAELMHVCNESENSCNSAREIGFPLNFFASGMSFNAAGDDPSTPSMLLVAKLSGGLGGPALLF